jgi:hypothetical protein
MVERGGEPVLAQKPVPEALVLHELRCDQLEGDRAVELEIDRAVDDAHPATAEQALDPVPGEGAAGAERRFHDELLASPGPLRPYIGHPWGPRRANGDGAFRHRPVRRAGGQFVAIEVLRRRREVAMSSVPAATLKRASMLAPPMPAYEAGVDVVVNGHERLTVRHAEGAGCCRLGCRPRPGPRSWTRLAP